MAETPEQGTERATVRLVVEMVATVRAEVANVTTMLEGLRALTKSEHEATQRQLQDVAGVPAKVARLEERVKALEKAQAWRVGVLPLFLIGLLGIGVTLLVRFAA